LDKPYHKAQIIEFVGDSKVIVDITFEDSNTEKYTLQLADIIRYIDKPPKKKSKVMSLVLFIYLFLTKI